MKKIIAMIAVMAVLVITAVPIFAMETGSDTTAEERLIQEIVTEESVSEEAEEFNQLMTELYEYWQSYTTTEGDNAFEKAVNFAWKYRGDIGGVSAAVAVAIFLLVMLLKFMPALKKYFNYIYKGNAKAQAEIMEGVTGEIAKYAPALATVEQVSTLYPAFCELVNKISAENAELKQLIVDVGARLEATEGRHAAEMKLQGETFRDIISLSALPVGKKVEILENYRTIMQEGERDEGDNI